MQVIFKTTPRFTLPKIAHRLSATDWNEATLCNLVPELLPRRFMFLMLIGKCDFKHFNCFRNCVFDFPLFEAILLDIAILIGVSEGEIVIDIQKSTCFDGIDDPMTSVYSTLKEFNLGYVFGDGCNLIREALVNCSDHSAISLDKQLEVVFVATVWQIE